VLAFCGVAAGFSGGCCQALRSVLTVFFCWLSAVTAPLLVGERISAFCFQISAGSFLTPAGSRWLFLQC